MSTRFLYRGLLTAALSIAPGLLLPAMTTASPAWSSTAGALQLDAPEAPSHCGTRTTTIRDRRKGNYTFTTVSWRDNSSTEDGFTVEVWWRNPSGAWVLASSVNTAANSTGVSFGGRAGPDYKFRVKAFNASGSSPWSNWGH